MTCTPVISCSAASEPRPFMTVGRIPDAPGGPGALNYGRDQATHGRTLRTCFLPARSVRPSFGALSSRSPRVPSKLRSCETETRGEGIISPAGARGGAPSHAPCLSPFLFRLSFSGFFPGRLVNRQKKFSGGRVRDVSAGKKPLNAGRKKDESVQKCLQGQGNLGSVPTPCALFPNVFTPRIYVAHPIVFHSEKTGYGFFHAFFA